MGIHNNFPAKSWIKLDGISVAKGEDVYIVSDFKTNLKYIYWSLETPNQLTASNVMLNRTSSRFLIVVNNKGESVLVPNEEITVSFDGNSVEAIGEHIWGLHEKNEEYGNKFVSIEQNIEGITQTVGQTKEELGRVSESVSKVEQKANSIDLSVKNLDREYNDNKNMQELRENINKSIIDINSALGIFKETITETFKDNEISEEETLAIQSHIEILEDRKTVVIDQVDRVIALMDAEGNQSEVTKLTSQKQAFINSIDNVITLVNTSISDNIIVPTEITVVTDAFGKANLAINTLKNTIDEIIFLGTGGTISEELARIGMKSDEIALSVTKVEEKVNNDTAFIKNELVGQIKDVNDALNGLEDTMNNSFLDGVLSESEKISLKSNLETLATEKLDIDKQYESIYNNVDLVGSPKSELKTAYNSYLQKYEDLINTIETVINKEGNIDINDQSNINSSIVAYRNALGDFSSKANVAIDSIAGNKANTVDEKYSEILLSPDGIVSRVGRVESKASSNGNRISSAESEIQQLANKITSTVTEGDVKSIIEQSPTEIKYGFNGISDYVTINANGLTVSRGSIACDSIKASSSHPIIKLFEGNGLNCALDATKHMEQGVGNAIRLKRDDANYILVGDKTISFYLTGSNNNESALCTLTGGTSNFKMNTKGGVLDLSNGVAYNGSKLAYENHTHSNYASSSHTHSNYASSSHSHSNYASSSYFTGGSSTTKVMNGNSSNYIQLYGGSEVELRAGSARLYISNYSAYVLYPANSGTDLGTSSNRWRTVYATNSLNTSDKKFKENIKYVDDSKKCYRSLNDETPFLDFIKDDLKVATYSYKIKDEDGYNPLANDQIGFIANDIADTKVGQTFIYDYGEEDGYMFSLAGYTTVVAKALQEEVKQRDKEILDLKGEVNDLKEKVNSLMETVNKLINN